MKNFLGYVLKGIGIGTGFLILALKVAIVNAINQPKGSPEFRASVISMEAGLQKHKVKVGEEIQSDMTFALLGKDELQHYLYSQDVIQQYDMVDKVCDSIKAKKSEYEITSVIFGTELEGFDLGKLERTEYTQALVSAAQNNLNCNRSWNSKERAYDELKYLVARSYAGIH